MLLFTFYKVKSYILQPSQYKIGFVAIFSILVSYVAQSVISANQLGLAVLGWICLGALVGYKNLFETDEKNKDRNIENSITASLYLQSNAMGPVTPINSLGNWLMTAQVTIGWLWYLVFVYIFVDTSR